MKKLLNLILGAFCFIIFAVGFACFSMNRWLLGPVLLLLGLIGMIRIFKIDATRERDEELSQQEINTQRIDQLKVDFSRTNGDSFRIKNHQALENQRPEEQRKGELIRDIGATGFVLKVHGPSGICIGLLLFIVAGLIFWPSPHDIKPLLGGAVSLLMGILFTVTAFPRIGRPVLELSISGISTPEYGHIPWSKVEGVDMVENSYRGKILSHTLIFHIPELDRYLNQFVAYQGFIYPFRSQVAKQQVRVMLRRSSEHPNVILDLSKELLNRDTDRTPEGAALESGKLKMDSQRDQLTRSR